MNCDLNDCEVYLQAALKDEEDPPLKIVVNKPIEKQYFLSVSRVSYGREVSVSSAVSYISGVGRNLPTHRLVVHDMKSAWTKSNRYDQLLFNCNFNYYCVIFIIQGDQFWNHEYVYSHWLLCFLFDKESAQPFLFVITTVTQNSQVKFI